MKEGGGRLVMVEWTICLGGLSAIAPRSQVFRGRCHPWCWLVLLPFCGQLPGFACITCVFVADAVAMRPTVVPIVTIVVVGTARTRIVVLVGATEFGFEECHLFF